jgi:hypothetical protein
VDLALAQTAVLLDLLLGEVSLLLQALTTVGQLGQADHVGLVGLQKAAVGTIHPVQSRPKLPAGGLLPDLHSVGLGDEPFELRR